MKPNTLDGVGKCFIMTKCAIMTVFRERLFP